MAEFEKKALRVLAANYVQQTAQEKIENLEMRFD